MKSIWKFYCFLGVFSVLFSCDSTIAEGTDTDKNSSTSKDATTVNDEEVSDNQTSAKKTIRDYCMLLSDEAAGLTVEERKKAIKVRTAKLKKVGLEEGDIYLDYFSKEGTPEGEGKVLGIERKQMAYWDIEGETGNAIIAVVTERSEGYQETGEGGGVPIGKSSSNIKFFKFENNQLKAVDIGFPHPKIKEVYSMKAEEGCVPNKALKPEMIFDQFEYYLPSKKGGNLSLGIDEMYPPTGFCGLITLDAFDFEWTGNGFKKTIDSRQ